MASRKFSYLFLGNTLDTVMCLSFQSLQGIALGERKCTSLKVQNMLLMTSLIFSITECLTMTLTLT